jgi:hypothetical protein
LNAPDTRQIRARYAPDTRLIRDKYLFQIAKNERKQVGYNSLEEINKTFLKSERLAEKNSVETPTSIFLLANR